jgi:signal transduction histidine kinase
VEGLELRERAKAFTMVAVAGFALLAGLDGGVNGGSVLLLALMPTFALVLLERRTAVVTVTAVSLVFVALAYFRPDLSPALDAMDPMVLAALRGGYLATMAFMLAALAAFVLDLQVVAIRARDEANEALREMIAEVEAERDVARMETRAKSAFLANISHEIRTPLNAIVGMTESTVPQVQGRPQESMAVVLQSAQTLLSLVDDLIDLSRIEAGRMRLDNREFDLRLACERVLFPLVGAARSRDQQIVLDVDEDACVLGDKHRISQVLEILVQNAIRHGTAGPVHVSVYHRTGQIMRFEVRDDGPGLDPDMHARIFDPFEGSTDGRGPGLGLNPGLGLTIAKALVECMGGSIGVESALGTGSSFHFDLPLPDSSAPPIPQVRLLVGVAVPESNPYRQALTRQLGLIGCEVVEPGAGPDVMIQPRAYDQVLEFRSSRSSHYETLDLPWRRDDLVEVVRRFHVSWNETKEPAPAARPREHSAVPRGPRARGRGQRGQPHRRPTDARGARVRGPHSPRRLRGAGCLSPLI